jgi:hypothetical protein
MTAHSLPRLVVAPGDPIPAELAQFAGVVSHQLADLTLPAVTTLRLLHTGQLDDAAVAARRLANDALEASAAAIQLAGRIEQEQRLRREAAAETGAAA